MKTLVLEKTRQARKLCNIDTVQVTEEVSVIFTLLDSITVVLNLWSAAGTSGPQYFLGKVQQ